MSLTAEDLAGRVRSAIESAGLTADAAARSAGMDPTALSRALNGKRGLSSLEVARLCEVLGADPLALLGDGGAPLPKSAGDAARVRQLARLDRLLTELGYPPSREHRYPATLLDRSVEAWLAGHISIRPVAGLIGVDSDDLLAEVEMRLPSREAEA